MWPSYAAMYVALMPPFTCALSTSDGMPPGMSSSSSGVTDSTVGGMTVRMPSPVAELTEGGRMKRLRRCLDAKQCLHC